MTINEIRSKYLNYFKDKKHSVIPSSAIVPVNDPTTLFTGSGMQPLVPYLLGEKHPSGNKLVNSQKCFRAMDIEEVGDNRHTTFFEMLGNWSLGDYFKEEQLSWLYDFLVEELGLPKERLSVTCFDGDEELRLPKDTASADIWKKLGISEDKIYYYGSEKNWWSRRGAPKSMPAGELGGPDSEVFYDFETPHDTAFGAKCHPNCDCGRFMEIGNSVFMEYIKLKNGSFELLPKKNVDFGGGLERIAAALNNNPDVFTVDTLSSIIQQIEIWTANKYKSGNLERSFRIVADHIRAAIFIISDGVLPSNTEQGYILRRLLRRGIFHADKLGIKQHTLYKLVEVVAHDYKDSYPQLEKEKIRISEVVSEEESKFRKTLTAGERELAKLSSKGAAIDGKAAFILFTTHGFPVELIIEIAEAKGVSVDIKGFQLEMEKHKKLSKKGAEQKFKGGLADNSEMTTMLHTATHLMLAGLRKYVGDGVHQAGSNITEERTRFDFTHPEKVGRELLDKVEMYVNDAIAAEADVAIIKMPKEKAKKSGVEGSFWEKYPDVVNVYTIVGSDGTAYSKELCGGPHVKNTREIKGLFKIGKEKASSAGVRRIKAVLE